MSGKYYTCLHDDTGVFAEAEFRDWADIEAVLRAYGSKDSLVMTVSVIPEEKEEES